MNIVLRRLDGRFAVCRLPPGAGWPWWVTWSRGLMSLTRTDDELSVVCEEGMVPEGVVCERGFVAFGVRGPLAFSATGIVAALAKPLADAGISQLSLATFDTDYVLVRILDAQRAADAWRDAGLQIEDFSLGIGGEPGRT